MANTLTGLIPVILTAADTVSREPVGMVNAVYMNADAKQAAKDQVITYPVVGASANGTVTAAATGPDPAGEVVSTGSMAITNTPNQTVVITAEEEVGLGDVMYEKIMKDRFEQAFRSLLNEVEGAGCALYSKASRAYGAAATAPFGTAGNFTDAAMVRKILVDNGAPLGDLQLVLGSTAVANLLALQSQAHIIGGDSMQRTGILRDWFGMKFRESAQVKAHTFGGAANSTTDAAGYAVGDKTITLASAGTGAWVAGDIVTSARDTNKYVIGTGDADVSGGGTIVLNNPGLRQARTTATDALTGTATYTANMAFARSAIHLLMRLPPMPSGGDAADEVQVITDPFSGVSFQLAKYRQIRRVVYEVSIAYGWKMVKPEHCAILIS